MAVTRTVATKALSRVTASTRQIRRLHMTDPSSLPARIATSDKSGLGVSQHQEVSKAESKRQGVPESGSKTELNTRPSNSASRAFSTSDNTYDGLHNVEPLNPSSDQILFHRTTTPAPFSPTNQSRQFNTSRYLKQVGDSSTIDFAYLPVFPVPAMETQFEDIRVPLLPHISRSDGSKAPMASEIEDIETSPIQISVVSAESTHLEGGPTVMAEAQEAANELDFQGVARQLALGLEREGSEDIRKAKGLVKQVWTGFVDDLFGQKPPKS